MWKQVCAIRSYGGSGQGTDSIIEKIFADSDKFNACLQSDYGLSAVVRGQVTECLSFLHGGVPIMCDILFLEANEIPPACEDEEAIPVR